jgi:hypothetical protein
MVLEQITHLVTLIGAITMTLKDIQDKVAVIAADAEAIKSVDAAAAATLSGLSVLLADVRAQLAAALAANDPAAIAAAVASLDGVHSTLVDQTDKLAAAIVSNPAQ